MRALALALLLGSLALATSEQFLYRFEVAWRLVKDYYYDPDIRGVDWDEVGRRYRWLVEQADSWEEVYRLIERMYEEVDDGHTAFLPPWVGRGFISQAACYPVPDKRIWQEPVPEVEGEGGEEEAVRFDVARGRVRDGVLYLRLPNLVTGANYGLLKRYLEKYDREVVGYVLDLRGNPGGLAFEMERTAGLFIRGWPWRLVTRRMGTMPLPTVPFWGEPEAKKPLVVLVDREVNSAAEGLAGALKNFGRARIFGERTAGNTEVVFPFCFPEGAVALVAVGVLAPLKGPTWEGRGVEPDYRVKPGRALEEAIRFLRREAGESRP